MAHIKEPDGVDFIIQSPPLTDMERKEISEMIKKMKAKNHKSMVYRRKNKRKEGIDKSEQNQ